jgi:membrane protein DedA with SNARE-associated domain
VAHAVTSFVESHGVLAVLILMTLESCGIPFPSEVVMPFGGALAASGHLSLGAVILAGAVGNLVGSLVAYLLAARFGEAVVLGPGRWIGLSGSHLALAERWFARRGLLAVFLGRLLPAVRTYISFPAGLARVDLARFSLLTFIGALPWCAALAAGGYALGASYERISGPIEKLAIVVGVALVAAVAVWLYRGRAAAVEGSPAR